MKEILFVVLIVCVISLAYLKGWKRGLGTAMKEKRKNFNEGMNHGIQWATEQLKKKT